MTKCLSLNQDTLTDYANSHVNSNLVYRLPQQCNDAFDWNVS